MEQVQVLIDGKTYSVIGGAFWDMLEAVKEIPGRAYERKMWRLPLSLEEIRVQLAPLQVVDEDGLLDAEIADIRRVQNRLLELEPEIRQRTSGLYADVKSYSYRSKSRIKAGKAITMSNLDHAIEYAKLSIEQLTEPQIKSLYSALRIMEGEE